MLHIVAIGYLFVVSVWILTLGSLPKQLVWALLLIVMPLALASWSLRVMRRNALLAANYTKAGDGPKGGKSEGEGKKEGEKEGENESAGRGEEKGGS